MIMYEEDPLWRGFVGGVCVTPLITLKLKIQGPTYRMCDKKTFNIIFEFESPLMSSALFLFGKFKIENR